MPAIRELPLAASLLVIGAALFFGGGASSGSLPWLGGAVLLALLALLATRGVPGGWPAIVPLALLALWLALTIAWSALPARSWEYANRALLYTLFAALGLWLAPRRRELALGLMALLGAVVVWSLLGKVLPPLYDDYGRVARLRGPVGLWNQLALLGDFALALALWHKGRAGTLLAYGWLVALALTYSRGGLVTAVLVVAAWLVLCGRADRERGDPGRGRATRPPSWSGSPSRCPASRATARQSSTRWRDGLIFGVLVVVGRLRCGRALTRTASARHARAPRVRSTPPARSRSSPSWSAASSPPARSRARARSRAAPAATRAPARTSAGSGGSRPGTGGQAPAGRDRRRLVPRHEPALPRLVPRRDDRAAQPAAAVPLGGGHRRPRAAARRGRRAPASGVAAARSRARAGVVPARVPRPFADRRRLGLRRRLCARLRRGGCARGPAGAAAGAAARAARRGRVRRCSRSPSCSCRGSGRAGRTRRSPPRPRERSQLADRAHSVDPLLVDPLWAKAFAAETLGEPRRAFQYYVQAVDREPKNPQTWRLAGEYAFSLRCYRSAYTYLEKYTELDPRGRPGSGGGRLPRGAARR